MAAPDPERERIEVRVDPEAWAVEVERFRQGSPARLAAERERQRLEQHGVRVNQLFPCAATGSDATRLGGELKLYVPITDGPASERPYGFVFSPAEGANDGRRYLALIAFGERHPARGTRSVYERAHKRLYGRYPDQEQARSPASGRSPQVRSTGRAPGRPQQRGGLER